MVTDSFGGSSTPPPPPVAPPPVPPPPPLAPPPPTGPAWGYGYPGGQPVPRTNGRAVGALVCGLIAIFIPFVFSLPALILGYRARRSIAASGGLERGAGSARAGIVLGWITLVVYGAIVVAGLFDDDHLGVQPEDVVTAVAPVCRGEANPDAGRYRGDGPFHLVIAGSRGRQIAWSTRDAVWRADSVADTELVACVANQYNLIETCPYVGGPAIDRYETVSRVRVVTARTGRQVSSFQLSAQPRACRYSEPMSLTRLEGTVPFQQVSRRLAEIARQPAVREDP